MKQLLTIGCSYSALYYHPDPRWSYTYLLKEHLGFDRLINLATGGLGPDGTFRLLINYLQKPVVGKPDFIFIQYPSAYRCEAYIDYSVIKDNINEDNWHIVSRTAFRHGYDLLRDYEKGKRWTNPNWTDETFELTKEDFKDIALIAQEVRPFKDYRNGGLHICPETVLRIFPSIPEEYFEVVEKHKHGYDRNVYYKILSDPRHAAVQYSKYLGLIEALCESHKIDYAYIDTDYSCVDAGVELPKEVYDVFGKPGRSDSVMEKIINLDWGNKEPFEGKFKYAEEPKHDQILDYCNNLFTRKNFIHGHSIGACSPTRVDSYPDVHPGKESHRLFAEKIAGILK